jgi:hypothetical protein
MEDVAFIPAIAPKETEDPRAKIVRAVNPFGSSTCIRAYLAARLTPVTESSFAGERRTLRRTDRLWKPSKNLNDNGEQPRSKNGHIFRTA